MFFDAFNVTSIRVLRVLRPLRTFGRVKGLKVLIETLLKAAPKIIDVVILLMFLLLVFGIAGVQVLKGIKFDIMVFQITQVVRIERPPPTSYFFYLREIFLRKNGAPGKISTFSE